MIRKGSPMEKVVKTKASDLLNDMLLYFRRDENGVVKSYKKLSTTDRFTLQRRIEHYYNQPCGRQVVESLHNKSSNICKVLTEKDTVETRKGLEVYGQVQLVLSNYLRQNG